MHLVVQKIHFIFYMLYLFFVQTSRNNILPKLVALFKLECLLEVTFEKPALVLMVEIGPDALKSFFGVLPKGLRVNTGANAVGALTTSLDWHIIL